MATGTIRVEGLRELDAAFKKMDKSLRKDFVKELKKAAEAPKELARQKILGELRNMPPTPRYAGQRVGVSGATTVYLVPSWKGGGGSGRPNLKGAIGRRMEAAVDEKSGEVEDDIGQMIDRMANEWGD